MKILYDYAMRFVGTPYRWGGATPIKGMDCSGFIQELLRSVGLDPAGDQTAQALYNFFEANSQRNVHGLGALVFYGKSVLQITHVAMMLDNYRVIEAGGGNSETLTTEKADAQGAFVRIRHLKHRNDVVAILKPRYSTIGVIA